MYNKQIEYKYLNEFNTFEDILLWENSIKQEYGHSYIKTTYWYLKEYKVKLVHRDKKRFNNVLKPEIDRFWEDVLKYRQIGVDSLLPKRKKELDFLPESD